MEKRSVIMIWLAVAVRQPQFVCPIRVDDILKAEYLPTTLLLEESKVDKAPLKTISNLTTDGHISVAFQTMRYHRSMMNEYLCRNYVAEQILDNIEYKNVARLGKPAKPSETRCSDNHRSSLQTLLNDQGSSAYKQWLSRSSVLDDVYRHYDHMNNDRYSVVELESGDVTGYAIHGSDSDGTKGLTSSSVHGKYPPLHDFDPIGGGESHHHGPLEEIPYNSGGDLTGYGGGERGDEHYYYEPEEHSSGKGLALKDLFDLALTALAFLAFGLFILNLIFMCLTGPQGTVIIMQTSTMTTTSTGVAREPLVTVDASSTRTRRSVHSEELLNEMAYRVMASIDRLTQLNQSSNVDHCLQYSLCQNNRYSRELNGNQRIWLPIWSFGISWLAGFRGEDRLGLLKASVLGLGDADCTSSFPSCTSVKHH